MKKTPIFALALMAIATILFSFVGPPAQTKYKVDTKQSTLVWHAQKVTGKHEGTVPITSGELAAEGNLVKEGSFEINVASLAVTDVKDAESNAKLTKHLKSDDFFGVEKFPNANFVLTSVTPKSGNEYTVKGKLTIKGKTNEIEFPATITTEGKTLTANAKITVDRTKYDVRYGSKTFFNDLGDKYIYDEFTLDLKLVANQQTGA